MQEKFTYFNEQDKNQQLNEHSIVVEIQNEYKKINNRWLQLHYKTFISLVVFAFLFEIIAAVTFYFSGNIEISLMRYVLKYILSPLIANSVFTVVGIWVIRFSNFTQKMKTYSISLLFVGVCFVFYTVHIIFASLYLVFFAPILLTIVYGDFILTTITASVSIIIKIITELFITWDPDKINPLSSSLEFTNFIISTFILLGLYCISIVVIHFEKEKNEASIKKEIEHYELKQKLIIDELTNIYNRTALRNAFEEISDDESDNFYIFAMIDLDDFKIINDSFGHQYGDRFLSEFGTILKNNCQINATPFRYGGDEFCILFKNTPMDKVLNICKNIQHDLKKNAGTISSSLQLTISIGIAHHKKGMPPKQLLRNTDVALYHSKVSKNSICVFDSETMANSEI